MTCIVCHRSVGTRAKKCSVCGAPTTISKGNFIFEISSADEKELKKYYEQGKTTHTEEVHSNGPKTNSASVSSPSPQAHSPQIADFAPQHTKRGKITDFLDKHSLSLLNILCGISLLGGIASVMTTPYCLLLSVIALLLSVYLIYSRLCYTDGRIKIFWICTIIGIATLIFSFIKGRMSTDGAANQIQLWAELTEIAEIDVAQQLAFEYKVSLFTPMICFSEVLMPLNYFLVKHEKKGNKIRKILAILGIILFFVFIAGAAYFFGYSMALQNAISNYLAN